MDFVLWSHKYLSYYDCCERKRKKSKHIMSLTTFICHYCYHKYNIVKSINDVFVFSVWWKKRSDESLQNNFYWPCWAWLSPKATHWPLSPAFIAVLVSKGISFTSLILWYMAIAILFYFQHPIEPQECSCRRILDREGWYEDLNYGRYYKW